jgi:hypothetical protein
VTGVQTCALPILHTIFFDCKKKFPAIRNFLCLKQIPENRGNVLTLKTLDCNDLRCDNFKDFIVIQILNEIDFIFTSRVELTLYFFLKSSTALSMFFKDLQPVIFIYRSSDPITENVN